MTDLPARRALILTTEAQADVKRPIDTLTHERGLGFAANWLATFSSWLTTLAHDGMILGTSHSFSKQARSFPYKKQAKLFVEYTPREMIIIQIYFAGQDWMA
jgi:hypothetical protein